MFKKTTFIFFGIGFWLLGLISTPVIAEEGEKAEQNFEKKMLGLMTYSDEIGLWQSDLADLYERMAEHSRKNNGAISARHLQFLRVKVREFHEIHRPRIESFLQTKEDFLVHGIIIKLISREKSQITETVRQTPLLEARTRERRGAIRFRGTKVKKYIINPNDELGTELLRELKIQFIAKIMLFEAYTLGLSPFIETKAFRGVLLRDLEGEETTESIESLWFEAVEHLFKRELLMDRLTLIQSSEKIQKDATKMDQALDTFIEKSVIVSELQKRRDDFSFFQNMARNMNFMAKRRWDAYRKLGVSILFQGSKLFGNTLGMFQSRRGYLYSWTKEQEEQIANNMKPLDLLFEKTPFRLTDRFIPGHFGHVAIWSGNEEQLKKLGAWDELPENIKKGVREGRRVLEALRPGVQFNTFRNFLDIDDLAVFRPKSCEEGEIAIPNRDKDIVCLNDKLRKEYLLKAFDQVGKDYDFAFDVNTEEKIVCSELIYRTFLDIDFETTNTVGMYNISPDQVAKKGDDEGDFFSPLFFFHNGTLLEERGEPLRSYIKSLMFPELP